MAPKKVAVVEKIPLGRPGNSLKLGVVGVPNSGKTTTMNGLGKVSLPTSALPFNTTQAKDVTTNVPDDRYIELCKKWTPRSEVPASVTLVDTCGIVSGSTQGEGMGMQFTSNIQSTDAVFHVVRCFVDDDICHLEDTIDPVRDMACVAKELLVKDLEYVDKHLPILIKNCARQKTKDREKEVALMQQVKECLDAGKPVRNLSWHPNDVPLLNEHTFLTAKSFVYLVNLSVEDFKRQKNKHLAKIAAWVKENDEGAPIVPFCAPLEEEMAKLAEAEVKAHLETIGAKQVMRDRIIRTGYSTLGLIQFFTTGEDEVRAWTIRGGSKCPQAAGVIHSDMERGFISADLYTYEDFMAEGSEANLKGAGKMAQKGKDYVVQDGDIMHVKFNVGSKKK